MTKENDIFQGYGVEVTIKDPDDFLKVKETLQRIGIPSYKDDKTLFQSCHILHKRKRYVIIHFLEMFRLDGRDSNFTKEDKARRDTIAQMLDEWGLVTILPDEKKRIETEALPRARVKVIPYKERNEWKLEPKYHIGKSK